MNLPPEGAPPFSPEPFLDYAPPGPAYDELLDLSGTVRGHWSDLWHALTQLGPVGLADRSEQSQHLLRENGVTYNVYGAAQEQDRPWILDPVPLLITAREHDHIARGLNQRARLLNEIARDLWGPQRLIESGRLPSATLFRHPAFFTACVGLNPPDGIFLHWYAAQLARGPAGEWLVLGDRSQGPSGVGYAIENRVVVGRALAHQFHQRNVLRLAQGFVALKHSLSRLASRLADSPRIVLLTPGPVSSKYFEDVYLARYLGYSLVEGGDLTVRGDAVFLKTLGGLLPVHLILRRVADTDCDPLELRPDSQRGVPGLTQAVRAGRVIMANALGSGLLEAPLLQAFLPDLCRELLGEPLLLPAVDTWWCGRAEDHAYVQAHLSQLLVREAFEHRGRRWAGWRMTAAELAELGAQIRNDPAHFVAQTPLLPSTAPTWSDSRMQSWHLTLRIFAFHNGGAWQTLPGGLCRVASQPDGLAESMAAGQRSKDVWVLSDGPVETITLLPDRRPALQLRRTVTDLPSRVADHLYWLGRLTERAEAQVRQVRSVIARFTTEVQPATRDDLRVMVRALSEPGQSQLLGEPAPGWSDLQHEAWSYLRDPRRLGGLAANLDSVRQTAATVRDRLSIDGWRLLNQMQLLPPEDPAARDATRTLLELNQVLTLLSAFGGLAADSMTRGPGWIFLDLGRRLERGLQTLRVVGGLLTPPARDPIPRLEALLEIADSSMTYRHRYQTTLQLPPVLDLLLADDTNPRSVIYQSVALIEHAQRLTGQLEPGRERSRPAQTAVGRLCEDLHSSIRLTDVEALCEVDAAGERRVLAEHLARWGAEFRQVSDQLTHDYLAHTVSTRQMTTLTPGREDA